MAAVHESLNNEIEALMLDNGGGIGDPHEMGGGGEWMSSFEQHPLRHMQDDTRPVIPIVIYMDGVRYTRATTIGKHDTLLNVNVVNLHTHKSGTYSLSHQQRFVQVRMQRMVQQLGNIRFSEVVFGARRAWNAARFHVGWETYQK